MIQDLSGSRLFINMKCLQCGKEIPEGRKFCSSSCSAKYNNVRRQRHPWTEEQKEEHRVRVEQVCKYCGKVTGRLVAPNREQGVCSECKSFVPRLKTLTQLGFVEGSLKDRYNAAVQKICTEYFDEKESLCTLSEKYGLDELVFYRILQQDSRGMRNISESLQTALEQNRIQLKDSPNFVHGTHTSWEGFNFHYRSSWEKEYMERLDKQKIRYEVEPFYVRYWDTQQCRERLAKPDFYLLDSNEIIELKSSYTYNEQNMKDKFQAYRKEGYIPKLLLDWKFTDL